jgi:hypothetical protein
MKREVKINNEAVESEEKSIYSSSKKFKVPQVRKFKSSSET